MNRHNRFYIQRFCMIPFTISEYVEIGNIKRMQEIKSFFEIFIGFTGQSNNNVGANCAMRHQCFDTLNAISIQFPLIPSAHQRQNTIASALQGNMEMRHDAIAVRNKLNNIIRQQVWLDG